jgi:hypothetical protein
MPSTHPQRTPEELALLGSELFHSQVKPALRPDDDGTYVAIDVGSGEYEIDADDYTAVMRLRSRRPDAEIWLERAGYPTPYKMRRSR